MVVPCLQYQAEWFVSLANRLPEVLDALDKTGDRLEKALKLLKKSDFEIEGLLDLQKGASAYLKTIIEGSKNEKT